MKTINACFAAVVLLIVLSGLASAQASTTLGRWMQQQPRSALMYVGCDKPLPYATQCWRHVVEDGRIVGVWHYRQETSRIVMWYTRR